MDKDLTAFAAGRMATASRPLLGLTVLVVEDSRFACEAMRLLCLRSGARIRRADCLRSAQRHLSTYRPGVLIVDLGLPDGSGLDLIRDVAAMTPRVPVLLATSGDPSGEAAALAAGADGFLPKPIESLAAFQQAILQSMPENGAPMGLRALADDRVTPDPLALQDDLAHAAEKLAESPDAGDIDYIARFVVGVARSAHDPALEKAALALRDTSSMPKPDVAHLSGMMQERLAAGQPF